MLCTYLLPGPSLLDGWDSKIIRCTSAAIDSRILCLQTKYNCFIVIIFVNVRISSTCIVWVSSYFMYIWNEVVPIIWDIILVPAVINAKKIFCHNPCPDDRDFCVVMIETSAFDDRDFVFP